jgi:hypothetical protein
MGRPMNHILGSSKSQLAFLWTRGSVHLRYYMGKKVLARFGGNTVCPHMVQQGLAATFATSSMLEPYPWTQPWPDVSCDLLAPGALGPFLSSPDFWKLSVQKLLVESTAVCFLKLLYGCFLKQGH